MASVAVISSAELQPNARAIFSTITRVGMCSPRSILQKSAGVPTGWTTDPRFTTSGGQPLVEDHAALQQGAAEVDSNRLTKHHATDSIREMVDKILLRLVNNLGEPEPPESELIFVEKTPKNSLRIPFFTHLFPSARFLFLWRDPRENVSSIMEAWRAGRWRTYRHLAGWNGPWSLLLPPSWQQLRGKSLEEVAAYQWECTNRIILDDLAKLPRERWCALSYSDLVANPISAIQRVMRFAEPEMDAGVFRSCVRHATTAVCTERRRRLKRDGSRSEGQPIATTTFPFARPVSR